MTATLIVPAAGKSSRYPNMKPKWMLTHPDGKLMIDKVLSGFDYERFDRTVITILQDHCDKHEGDLVLRQVFGDKVDIVILPEPTESVVDTVSQTVERANIEGNIVIKDSDCVVQCGPLSNSNYVVGLTVDSSMDVERVQQKSFILKNDDGIITDIVEKKIVSDIICLGVYAMTTDEFLSAKQDIENSPIYKHKNEIYFSHIVSYLLMSCGTIFEYIEAENFIDWGTKNEWVAEQKKYSTYIFDIDGVMLENHGKYGSSNWSNTFIPIEDNIAVLKELSDNGHEIVFMTSRTEDCLGEFKELLQEREIKYKEFICGCNHSRRIIVNDFATTNPYPSCDAICIKRNDLLRGYLHDDIKD